MFKPEDVGDFLSLATSSSKEFCGELDDRFTSLLDAAKTTLSGLEILDEALGIAELLIDKNKKYGDSALNPLRVFSKANAQEQILVRLDDKLSRIARGVGENEDPIFDIMGYLVLLRIAMKRAKLAEEIQAGVQRAKLAEEIRAGVHLEQARLESTPSPDTTTVAVDPTAVSVEPTTTSADAPVAVVKEPHSCQECGKPVETDDSALCGACFKRRWARDPVSSVPRY